jgi:hypothetical protein
MQSQPRLTALIIHHIPKILIKSIYNESISTYAAVIISNTLAAAEVNSFPIGAARKKKQL